jgi:phosphoglycerol transferase MdoB-like AlkP superfamily enzyme
MLRFPIMNTDGQNRSEEARFGVSLSVLLLFTAFLALKLYATWAPETFADAGYPIWHLQLYSIVQDLGVLALILLLAQLPWIGGRILAGLILVGYIIDALLVWALFVRLTPFELIEFTDEPRAIASFVRLPVLALVVLALSAAFALRTRSLRLRRSLRPAFLTCLAVAVCLPWILPEVFNIDPYLDFGYSNFLRFNGKLVWFRGVDGQSVERASGILPSAKPGIETLVRNRVFEVGTLQPGTTEHADPAETHPNVILLLSESLSQIDSRQAGGEFDRIPQIDSIAQTGMTLTNLISDGSATSDALASLLLGIEPLPTACLSDDSTARFPSRIGSGSAPANLVETAAKAGYRTAFLSNSRLRFQSNSTWLASLGFDEVEGGEAKFYSDKPRLAFASAPDEFLYQRALRFIDRQKAPYFLTLMTISLHPPYESPHARDEVSKVPLLNILHYVDRTTYDFYASLRERGFFKSGVLLIVGDHRRMTPLEGVELRDRGIDALGRIFGCLTGAGVPVGIRSNAPLNQSDLTGLLADLMAGGAADFDSIQNYNKGIRLLGLGFPFTVHLINPDLGSVLVRVPGRAPATIVLSRRKVVSHLPKDARSEAVTSYLTLWADYLQRVQTTCTPSL